jgi:spore coat polysaccharide biosynthesis predicted glycosyltransferase SpsG
LGCHFMKKVLFRADARPTIGIGDLMSLIHLSKYFEDDKWETHFMIRGYDAGVKLAKRYNLKHLEIIPSDISVIDEVDVINQYSTKKDIDMLFFEITERKLTEYQGLLPEVKKACVCFDGVILDDLNLVVDWDVAASKYFRPENDPNSIYLLGPKYVILPKEFYCDYRIKQRNYNSKIKNVLIAMGGADEFNFTQKIVELLIKKRPDLYLTIIIGSGYEFRKKLEDRLSYFSANYSIKHNITNMLDEYLLADIGIGAGGLISSELVASRTPALLLATCEHQVARCQYYANEGWAIYLGLRTFDEKSILTSLEKVPQPKKMPFFNTKKIVETCNELQKI